MQFSDCMPSILKWLQKNWVTSLPAVVFNLEPRGWIENQGSVVPTEVIEIEHLVDGVGDGIKRTARQASTVEPVVFDEAQHRGLVGDRVVNEVFLRPRRNDDQRQARTVSAAALRMCVDGRIGSGKRGVGAVAASAGTGQGILCAQ